MADKNQNKAEQYRKERKERLAKAAKKNAKNIEKKTAARSAVKKVVAIVVAAVVVLSCLGGIFNYVGITQSLIKIGYVKEEHISFAEYQYYFMNVYNNFFQQQYQAAYNGTTSDYDTTLPPDQQTTTTKDENGGEITWVEYLHNQTVETIKQTSFLYQQAKEAGLELNEGDKKKIEDTVEKFREQADTYGKSGSDDTSKGYSLNAYLRKQYGNGVNTSFLKKQLEKESLISKFQEYKVKELKKGYSEDKINTEFNKDPDSYLYVDLRMYQYSLDTLEANEGENDKELRKRQQKSDDKVKANAQELKNKAKDEKSFINIVKEQNKDTADFDADAQTKAYSMQKGSAASQSGIAAVNEDLANWAFDKNTKANDKKLIEVKDTENNTVSAYIVAIMVNPKHDTDTVSVRHILFKTVNDDGTALPDSELKAAKVNADKALADWKAGDKTEDSFADLATELTEDTGSQSTGGLYEAVAPNTMVKEFDAWIFDANRKAGDTDIVKTDYGYHVMYFVEKTGSAKDNTIRTNLANADFTSFLTEKLEGDEYATAFGSRRVNYVEKGCLKLIKKQVRNINANAANQTY